jgi:Leucine-rich repeat (LRR) protein
MGSLSALTELDLSRNQLIELPDTMGNLSVLTSLNLCRNQLTEPPSAMSNLSALTSLDLSTNQLTELPDTMGNLSALTSLNLCRNLLTRLPSSMGSLSSLTSLDLSRNQLIELPDTMGNLSVLTSLNLCRNQLTELPSAMSNLSALTELDLSWNLKFTGLPNSIGNLLALTSLNLSQNRLTELPVTIGNLSALTSLNLKWNPLLTGLPNSIGNLLALTILDLSGNRLTELPSSIGNLSALRSLNLSRNRLTGLPLEITNLGRGCTIELTECPIPENVLERIRDITRSPNYAGPHINHSILDNRPEVQKTVRECIADLYHSINQLPKELSSLSEISGLESWLNRLSRVAEYSKVTFARKIVAFLEEADRNEKFRAVFEMTIGGASQTCGDRMTLSVLHLGLNYTLATFDLKEMQKLADFLKKGVWTINILEDVAHEKTLSLPFYDEIEVYLGYPIKLKRDLDIPIDVEEMLYFRCSGLTSEDIQKAKESVLSKHNDQKAYLDFLVENETWRQALALNYPREFENAKNLKTEALLRDPLGLDGYSGIEQPFYDKLKELSRSALVL